MSASAFIDLLTMQDLMMQPLDEWFETICRSYSHPPTVVDGLLLPGFPPDNLQANTTGQTGVATLKEAFVFYQDCVETFASLGAAIQYEHTLLDFGMGWGRIARFFLRDLPLANIHGLDVMDEFVEICRNTFRSTNFHATPPFPPSPLEAGTYNYIVGYSVFSHLSERACAEWMQEFHRLLAPGGMVALTTRGRPFLYFCESMKGQGHTGYLGALSSMFDDFNAARSSYDRGEFVHSNREGVSGGGAMTTEFYGETFIPRAYAARAYSHGFVLERFQFDPPRQSHPIMFFRKK